MDFEKARFNMVEQQVRPWDVLDARVLAVINAIPREDFTPDAYKNLAYADTRIPLSNDDSDCCMLNPNIEGRILQHLDISDDEVVLEIGTGTGYLTACLASLARHVDTVEINEDLSKLAEKNLAKHGFDNITLSTGDASKSWTQKQFYDAIAITGSMPEIPESYKKMLKEGGRLFVITGEAPAMTAQLVTRTGKNTWTTKGLFETCIGSLCGIKKAETFSF
ncbi:MAG: protein-L-isoaspartate O-methyltransferase [Gammaproteobacteria bacterium]|nr:protein-L-isoaspartate O-methyltransferase [Gammaproteobacteria bacterium]